MCCVFAIYPILSTSFSIFSSIKARICFISNERRVHPQPFFTKMCDLACMRVMHVCKFPFCLNFSLHTTSRSRFGGSQDASNSPRYWLLRIVLLGSACHKWQTFCFLSANFCTISCQAAYRIPGKYLIERLQLFVACIGDTAHSGAVHACKWVEA